MKLEIDCAMCGKEKVINLAAHVMNGDARIKEIVIEAGWIVQQNGPSLDIYCSRKCAD